MNKLKEFVQGLNIETGKERLLLSIDENDIKFLTGFISCLFLNNLITLEEHAKYFDILTNQNLYK